MRFVSTTVLQNLIVKGACERMSLDASMALGGSQQSSRQCVDGPSPAHPWCRPGQLPTAEQCAAGRPPRMHTTQRKPEAEGTLRITAHLLQLTSRICKSFRRPGSKPAFPGGALHVTAEHRGDAPKPG